MTPRKCVGSWLDAYLEYTSGTLPPRLFHLWCGISALSAALQRSVWAQADQGAIFYPNFYCFLVGEPGTGKSTAIDLAQQVVGMAGINLDSDSTTSAGLRAAFKRAYDRSAKQKGLETAHSSVIVFADELETFLKSEKYDPELFQLLTKAYNNPNPLQHETLKDGLFNVPRAFLSILGGIQPDNLNKRIPPEMVGSGFASRVLFVYHPPRFVELGWKKVKDQGKKELEDGLVADLKRISRLAGEYDVTDGYVKAWDKIATESANQSTCPHGKALLTYWRRRVTHLTKLSMVLAASRRDELMLEEGDLKDAETILREAEVHMPAVVSSITSKEEGSVHRDIVGALRLHGPQSESAICKCYEDVISEWEMVNRVLRDLVLARKVEGFRKDEETWYRIKEG